MGTDTTDTTTQAPGRQAPGLVALLTPTLGTVSMFWHSAVMSLAWPMNCQKAAMPKRDMKGGEIGEVRNRCIQDLLDLEAAGKVQPNYVVWLDDDVIPSPLGILQLLTHDADVAAGVYFTKMEVPEPLIFPGPAAGTTPFRPGKVFRSWGYAQGWSVVKFDVYKRIIRELNIPKDKYGSYQFFKQPDFGFTPEGALVNGGTEDFHFWHLLERIGVKPVVDCTKHGFAFHFDLKAGVGYPKPQWEQWLKGQPLTWETPDGPVTWD